MGLTTLWQALLDGPVPWPPARFRGRGRHAPDPPVMRSHRGPARSVRPSHAVRTGFAALLVGACVAPALHAQSSTFSGAVALSSQLVDRGQAITRTTPILQGAASWTFPAGWSLGLSASTEVRSPGHVVAAAADIFTYSRSKGLFGGASMEGAWVTEREGWNQEYYGQPVRSVEILRDGKVSNAQADPLRETVAKITESPSASQSSSSP